MSLESSLGALRSAARLGYWLGPWHAAKGNTVLPRSLRAIVRRRENVGETDAYVFTAQAAPQGTYVVLQGLHYEGPDDPRLDRFCRVLAASGFLVIAPNIRSFRSLSLDPSAFDDARAALHRAHELAQRAGHAPPAVFSISFGSRLAIDLATVERPPSEVLLFGGFAEFFPTVRFAVTGVTRALSGEEQTYPHDLLNAPAVFLNLLPELEVAEKARLADAWIAMVRATWGKDELTRGDARRPFADRIAAELPAMLREPFYRGCGLGTAHAAWLEEGISRASERLAFMDPRSDLANIKCKVTIVHGRDDDVIPCVEADKLAAALPKSTARGVHKTGLYGHTGSSGVPLRHALEEVRVMSKILWSLGSAPRG